MDTIPRWTKVAMVISLLALLAGGVWFYRTQEQILRQETDDELSSIAQLKINQIVAWRKEKLDNARALTINPLFTADIARWLANPTDKETEEIRNYFHNLQELREYQDILLVDSNGQIRVSMNNSFVSVHPEVSQAITTALRNREPVLTDLHTDDVGLKPHISVVAPLFSENEQGQQTIGAIVLVIDAEQFLYPLVQFWPTPSETSETLLVRRDGDNVLFLNNLRHQPDTALKLRIPLSRADLPAVMAVQGITGIVEGRDYRSVNVIAVVEPVPNSPWFMVTKVDSAEALAGWRFRSAMILAVLLGLMALISVIWLVVWQQSQKAHFRALYESEVARRAGETRYGITLNSIGDAVIATDAQGRVELMNPVAETLTGWSQAEARGRPLTEVFAIINEETRQPVDDPVTRILREAKVIDLANHTILIARDGTEYPIADSGAPILNEQGVTTGVVLVFRDQTEDRAAQQALRNSEASLRESQRVAHVGHWTWDIITNVVVWSDEMKRIFGLDPASFSGDLSQIISEAIHPDDRQKVNDANNRVLMEQKTAPMEYRVVRPDQSVRTVRAVPGDKVVDENGNLLKLTGIVQDITEQKRLEAENKKLADQFYQSQKMESIGQLAGGIAHDLNNVLVPILGYAELGMLQLSEADKLYDNFKQIKDAADRAATLTRQILAFSRRQVLELRVLDVNEVIVNLKRMLQRLIGEQIIVQFFLAPGPARVKADAGQLEQVLLNLVINARDAMPTGGTLTVETGNVVLDEDYATNHPGVTPGPHIMLAVTDTGHGMDVSTQQHIFEPFFTTKEHWRGTGLGLATVFGIVKQHEGNIWVYSEPGHGSIFKIYLPVSTVQEPQDWPATPITATDFHGHETVLVVEDEPGVRRLVCNTLLEFGYQVLEASTPDQGVALAASHPNKIDLLLTDVIMPKMNGRQLYEYLTQTRPKMRVLFMSGYTENVIVHHGVLNDGILLLQKPFVLNNMLRKVRTALA